MNILAIETSCDETAAAVISCRLTVNGLRQKNTKKPSVVRREPLANLKILSNIIASQIDLHKQYGGVFPEIASRAHAEQIIPVVQKAVGNKDYDVIAVATGPGLIGSLLVGVNFAKTLAYATDKPIIGINHWLGHIYSNFVGKSQKTIPAFPALILIASGGHTGLVLMKSHKEIVTLGETLDDAAGEAFDKVAKILGLGYPGGPAISAAAEIADGLQLTANSQKQNITKPSAVSRLPLANLKFPRSMLDREDYNFSFSGLKTAVLYKVKEIADGLQLTANSQKQNITKPSAVSRLPLAVSSAIAKEFQQAVIDILIGKTLQAARQFKPKSICLCGGVSANKELRVQMELAIRQYNNINNITNITIDFFVPPISLATDNAAMIGLAAAYQLANGQQPTTYSHINADANLKL